MNTPTEAELREACSALAAACPVMARAFDEGGLPVWRAMPASYAGLARIIAFQQISVAAAATIWGRVETGLGEITPASILGCPEEALRGFGLSRPKVSHLRSIALAEHSGALNMARLMSAPMEAARAELLDVRGVGPWTAEVFLMYARGALDAFPWSDIGLSESWRLLSGAPVRPPPKDFREIGEAWSPWRGVATHLLWQWINKQRENAKTGSPQP